MDPTLLDDQRLAFKKCVYIAIGLADDTSGGPIAPLENVIAGNIAEAFGTGGTDMSEGTVSRMWSILKKIFQSFFPRS